LVNSPPLKKRNLREGLQKVSEKSVLYSCMDAIDLEITALNI
jgi:hypothetical protein